MTPVDHIHCLMTVFDKIHLAELARIRAGQAVADLSNPEWERRHRGEFDSAVCWMQHRCCTDGPYNFNFPSN